MLDAEEQYKILMRGVIDQVPGNALLEKLKKSVETGVPLRVKMGVDPTAPDVHLGHTVVMRKLRQFQDLGHTVVLIVGDYTATVGDPTGRNTTRPPLSHEQVLANAETYKKQFFKIVDESRTEVVYNGQWFSKMSFLEILAVLSRLTVAQMLERQDFARRYANGVSIGIHEFVYPLMQGWDSVEIRADVELGGTDQKFNVIRGRELQEWKGMEGQVGLFLPILLGTDGERKMSKSIGNYVGVNEPPQTMYHKIYNIADAIVPDWYRLLTDVPIEEVDSMADGISSGRLNPMELKHRLAKIIVSQYHGEDAAENARISEAAIQNGSAIPDDAPRFSVSEGEKRIVDLLLEINAFDSKGNARRMIANGGVKIGGEKLSSPEGTVAVGRELVVQVGKRKFYKINF